jgi:DNA-binding FadR family transcriptional regulator
MTTQMKQTGRSILVTKRARQAGGQRRPKSHGIVDALGNRIIAGKLAPGALLPTEAELASQLKISRPSLRQGLHALELKGLIERRTRRGTVVTPRSQWDVLDPDVLRWIALAPPDPTFFMELLDVRSIFEPAAARLAASRAGSAEILGIEAALRGMAEALPDDVDGCCAPDLAFHERIIAATGNPLLIRFAAAIRTALLAAFRLSSNARESYENSLAEHWAVAAAIRNRDPDAAERAMQVLLAGTARDLAPAYEGMADRKVMLTDSPNRKTRPTNAVQARARGSPRSGTTRSS